MKPIEDLTDLERRIVKHHILTYPHFTTGLSTPGIFKDAHPDETDAAISRLVQYGYYNKPQHSSVSWTSDGYHRCQNYFKMEIGNIQNNKKSKNPIPYPDKITLKWLHDYVPFKLWIMFFALLLSAFTLGTTFSSTKIYNSLINWIAPNINENAKAAITKP